MTVTATDRRAGPFYGNGVTTQFPFTFKVFSAADLEVTYTNAAGVAAVITSGFTVTLNADQDANPGGYITYPLSGSPMASPASLVAIGATAYSQPAALSNVGRFLPEVHERAFDRQAILSQQLAEKLGRQITIPPDGPFPVAQLPYRQARYDRLLAFDDITGQPEMSPFTVTQLASTIAAAYSGAAGPLDALSFIQAGTGAVSRTAQNKAREIISIKDFGAIGDWTTDDTAAIQAALDAAEAAGGGKVLIPRTSAAYRTTDTLTVGDNVGVEFDGWIKLDGNVSTSTGTVLLIDGDNVEIINPLIDANNAGDSGENGIGIISGNKIQVRGGKIINCPRGGVDLAFGGKGIQIEPGGVEGILIDGMQFSSCFMAMSTIRDASVPSVGADYGILFSNIKADNCEILLFVRQVGLNNTDGLQHTVQLNNFYAVNCGAFEGVMQFSRAANVEVANGIVVNDPGAVTTPLIRGNHRFCRFDNILFNANCSRIIDLDPSTFAIDSSYVCENNTYDINHSGVAGYVVFASLSTANRILQDSRIRAMLDSDLSSAIMGDELRNGYCLLELQQGGKTIVTTTATLYLEGRTNFASYPAGISMMRFNSSQISFPAPKFSSADPNTLDDYEEGTWTPVDGSGAGLALTGYGHYTKIGRLVAASMTVTYPATAAGGNAVVGGLPFPGRSTGGQATAGFSLRYTDLGAMVSAVGNPGVSTMLFAALAGTVWLNSDLSGKTISGVLLYFTD